MRITSATYTIRRTLGHYQHEEFTVTAESDLDDKITGEQLIAAAKEVCFKSFTKREEPVAPVVTQSAKQVATAPIAHPTPAHDIPKERKGVSAGKYIVYEIPTKDTFDGTAESLAGTSWKKTFYVPEIGTFRKVRLSRVLIPSLNDYYKATISVNDKGSVRFEQGEDVNPQAPVPIDDDIPFGMNL